MAHPKYELPKTPHAEYRYKMAMKHVEAAKAAGKSSTEIHEMFNQIMTYDIDNPVNDEAHKKYNMAVLHAKKALAQFIADLGSGKVNLYAGPLEYQDGAVFVQAGSTATDKDIWFCPQLGKVSIFGYQIVNEQRQFLNELNGWCCHFLFMDQHL